MVLGFRANEVNLNCELSCEEGGEKRAGLLNADGN